MCVIIANKVHVNLKKKKKGLWHTFIIELEPEDTFFFFLRLKEVKFIHT